MKKIPFGKLFIVTLFVAIIAVPIFTIRWTGGDYSETEKRVLAPIPNVLLSDGAMNPNVGSEIKNWFEDHIGQRDKFTKLSGKIKLGVFGQSPSNLVHLGKDDWYFYTQDSNLEIAQGTYPLSDETLEAILQNHLAIRDKLAEKGTEYVIVLPVSKASIYPEYMRYGSGEVRETPVDIVANHLEANSDLKVIRLKDALLEAKKDGQVFFKTDTHWTQYGAYAAYQKIISDMNRWNLCGTEAVEVRFEDGEYLGEFGAMMGSVDFIPPEPTQNSVIQTPNAVKNAPTERYNELQHIITLEGIRNPCYHYTNDSPSGPSVLMYGDSMFGSWNITELMAENFSEFTYIWNYDIRESLVDYLSPDIVIYEITERYLNVFTNYNRQFLQQKLSDYQAEVLQWTISDNDIRLTVKNTSSSIWNNRDQIRCGLWLDGKDSGARAEIPVGIQVNPGEKIEFLFENIYFGAARVEAQMLQEGICYFGEKEVLAESQIAAEAGLSAEITSHDAPRFVNHNNQYTINVTVKNVGTSVWSEDDQIRLCIWQDGVDWGYRLNIPRGVAVNPGDEYTFTLEGFVLPEASSTILEFQMLQEGVTYFGERETVGIVYAENH